jgi:asparagine synthase (glutamine-hydrolysing)
VCGIHGVLQPRGDVRAGIDAMHAALAHRGPDGDGIASAGDAILGHRRLSIIDLSAAGAQPLWDVERRTCIVFNGEIYNYRQLRDECRAAGLEFHSTSDTEVIVNLYLLHGESSFAMLNGIFAFCLADVRSGDSYLVRDRAGIKPLYYAQTPSGLAFASELGALIKSGLVDREVDHAALQAYTMLDFVPSPMSMLCGVRKLPGGSILRLRRDGNLGVSKFIPSEVEGSSEQPAEISDRRGRSTNASTSLGINSTGAPIKTLLREVVERQLVADVPVGVFLSGGIDSSLVAANAADAAGTIDTFSIAFDDPSFDERRYFDGVAKTIGSRQHTEILNASAMAALLPRIAEIVTEPLADGSIFPTMLLSRFARSHVKVVLSGDGADELFAGYPTHVVASAGRIAALSPRVFRRIALGASHALLPASHENLSREFKIKKWIEGADRDPIRQNERWLASFQPEDLPSILERFDERAANDLDRLLHEPSHGLRGLEAILRTDRRFYLEDGVLVKTDRASMSVALEVRVPFLDNAMIAFADSLPANLKLRRGTTKWILRQLARERFPKAIWARPKKGFGAPLARWFAGELRDFVRDTLSRRRGFYRTDAVTRLLDEHESGRRDHRKKIFNVLMFSLWYDWMTNA